MKTPTFSVTVQNYNHAHLLPNCLESILNQSLQPFEILVLDDASTDNSVEVIKKIAQKHPHIKLVQNERNLGAVGNVNLAVRLARGDYVFSSAADDQLLPGFFEKCISILSQHPQAALCCTIGDWRELNSGLNWHVGVGMSSKPGYISPDEMVNLGRRGKLFIAGHTIIFQRRALAEVGYFDPELKWHCDWFAAYVAGFRHGICYVPEPLGIANIHATSYYQSGHAREQAQLEVLRAMLDRLNRPEMREVSERIRASGALGIYGVPILKLMLRHQPYRHYLTATFLRKNFWRITQLQLKRITPAWAGNLYFKFSGLRARKT